MRDFLGNDIRVGDLLLIAKAGNSMSFMEAGYVVSVNEKSFSIIPADYKTSQYWTTRKTVNFGGGYNRDPGKKSAVVSLDIFKQPFITAEAADLVLSRLGIDIEERYVIAN